MDPAEHEERFHLSAARRRLGQDPEARFHRATSTKRLDALDLEGLREALGSEVKISDRALSELFKELDVDGDGKITKDEFLNGLRAKPSVEGFKATVSLLHSFGIVEIIAKHYTRTVQRRLGGREEAELELPTLLEHAASDDLKVALEVAQQEIVMHSARQLELLRENKQCAVQAKEFSDKFAFDSTAFEETYKTMAEFLAGVEGALGLPGHDIHAGIAMEFCHSDDSRDAFSTTNYGGMQTTPLQEYHFVTMPELTHRCDSGRNPVPLRIFLLAAYSTPLEELEPRERSAVRSVLLRRVLEAGLSSGVLKAAARSRGALKRLGELTAEELNALKTAARQALLVVAVDPETGQPPFEAVAEELKRSPPSISLTELHALLEHMRATLAGAGLTEEEVIALRLYTGPAYMKLNGTLREMEHGRKGNRYVSTIFATISGMVKLAAVSPIPPTRVVYRGQNGMRLPECFWRGNEQGVKGGVEMAFLSTTTDLQVAIDYAGANGKGVLPTVFAIQVGAVDNGAAVGFLSQYPDEEEILMPPRSFLEVLAIPVALNCNLLSPTLEKIRDQRKALLVAAVEHSRKEIARDLEHERQSEQLRARAKLDIFWEEVEEGFDEPYSERFFKSIRHESDAALRELRERPAAWFRSDGNFKWAMKEVLELKRIALGKLKLWMEAENLYVPYLSKISGLDCDRKAVGRLVRLLEEAKVRAEASPSAHHQAAARELALKLCKHEQLVGSDIDERLGRGSETALMREAAEGNAEAVSLLLLAGADPDAARTDGRTALMLAAQCGQTDTARVLVREGGADPNARDTEGRTCIFYAAGNGHTETARLLICECGADPLARSHSQWTAVHASAYDGYLDATKLFVLEGGVGVDAVDRHGWSASLYAAQNGHRDVLGWLIGEAGGDVEAADTSGRTAVMLAAQNGHQDVLEWLVEEGDANVNAVSADGLTAVRAARHMRHMKVVDWLVHHAGAYDRTRSDTDSLTRKVAVTMRSRSGGEEMRALRRMGSGASQRDLRVVPEPVAYISDEPEGSVAWWLGSLAAAANAVVSVAEAEAEEEEALDSEEPEEEAELELYDSLFHPRTMAAQ